MPAVSVAAMEVVPSPPSGASEEARVLKVMTRRPVCSGMDARSVRPPEAVGIRPGASADEGADGRRPSGAVDANGELKDVGTLELCVCAVLASPVGGAAVAKARLKRISRFRIGFLML